MFARFQDRTEAGRLRAGRLDAYRGRDDVLVLGLPRGGVPVAFEVARALDAPLDVMVVRKLGVPGHEELAMGALATGNVRVINGAVVRQLGIPAEVIDRAAAAEQRELARRELAYRGGRPPPRLRGRVAILVDDGLATGATMQAAVRVARREGAARVVVAVPVAPRESCAAMAREADEVVCAASPAEPFYAIGYWYERFPQVGDDEVRRLLAGADRGHTAAPPPPPPGEARDDSSFASALEIGGIHARPRTQLRRVVGVLRRVQPPLPRAAGDGRTGPDGRRRTEPGGGRPAHAPAGHQRRAAPRPRRGH
jgi:predicted phosphoribosyltransferase